MQSESETLRIYHEYVQRYAYIKMVNITLQMPFRNCRNTKENNKK